MSDAGVCNCDIGEWVVCHGCNRQFWLMRQDAYHYQGQHWHLSCVIRELQRKADALDKVFQHKQLRVVWETPDEATGRFPMQRTLHTIEAIESVPALEEVEDE